MTKRISLRRLARLFSRIEKPATASRAAERVYALSQRAASPQARAGYLALSEALNEHRHMLLATFRGDVSATREHASNRNIAALRANALVVS